MLFQRILLRLPLIFLRQDALNDGTNTLRAIYGRSSHKYHPNLLLEPQISTVVVDVQVFLIECSARRTDTSGKCCVQLQTPSI